MTHTPHHCRGFQQAGSRPCESAHPDFLCLSGPWGHLKRSRRAGQKARPPSSYSSSSSSNASFRTRSVCCISPTTKARPTSPMSILQLSEELMGCAHGIFFGIGLGLVVVGLDGLVVVFVLVHVLSFYPGYVRGKRVMTQKY